jgi:hypothetical protein
MFRRTFLSPSSRLQPRRPQLELVSYFCYDLHNICSSEIRSVYLPDHFRLVALTLVCILSLLRQELPMSIHINLSLDGTEGSNV